jgi:hypothetical protein
MRITLPVFTPMQKSLFLTLCGRALDNRSPHPILADTMSDEIVGKLGCDCDKFRLSASPILNIALRAKKLDQVALNFIARHPDAVVLDRLIGHFPVERWPSTATPGSPSGRRNTTTAPNPLRTSSSLPASTTPRARTLEPQTEAGRGNPAHARTRGRRVPAGPSPVHPPGSAQRSLVAERDHRPALPLLASTAWRLGSSTHRCWAPRSWLSRYRW